MALPSSSEVAKFFEDFLAVSNETDGWTDVTEKLGVKKVRGESGIALIRGEGIIKATPEEVKNLLGNIEQRGKWDTVFDSGKVLKKLDDQYADQVSTSTEVTWQCQEASLVQYKTKSSMTVWSRDFAVVAAARKEEGGGYTLIAQSVDPAVVPPAEGCVRATVLLSGFRLLPSDGGTRVTYIFQVDAAGWVPTSMVNLVNTYQPLGIIGMRKILTGSPKP